MRVDTGRLRVVPSEVGAPDPAAADDGLPSPGRYVQDQRIHQGLSLEEMSRATKIPVQSLALLEADRFAELPGPVFAKGFLRVCARTLGLEQDRVLELHYERERAVARARRPQSRPVTGSHTAPLRPPDTGRSLPVAAGGRPIARILSSLTATNLLLWIVVALFLAVLLMAAFNLGAEPRGGPVG